MGLLDRVAIATILTISWACSTAPAPEAEPERPAGELLATYHPSPYIVIDRMLRLAELKPGELLYDPGSGDGRILVHAAERYKARTVGFEIDPTLIRQSRRVIQRLGLADRAAVEGADLLRADYSKPDVVTLFITPEGLEKLAPALESQMKPGSRTVSYKFPLPNRTPDETVVFKDDSPDIPDHEIYLYRR